MNATAVLARVRKAARAATLTVEQKAGKGAHRKITVGGHCKTTLSFHPGDVPTGTLKKIESDLEHCLGADWL